MNFDEWWDEFPGIHSSDEKAKCRAAWDAGVMAAPEIREPIANGQLEAIRDALWDLYDELKTDFKEDRPADSARMNAVYEILKLAGYGASDTGETK